MLETCLSDQVNQPFCASRPPLAHGQQIKAKVRVAHALGTRRARHGLSHDQTRTAWQRGMHGTKNGQRTVIIVVVQNPNDRGRVGTAGQWRFKETSAVHGNAVLKALTRNRFARKTDHTGQIEQQEPCLRIFFRGSHHRHP